MRGADLIVLLAGGWSRSQGAWFMSGPIAGSPFLGRHGGGLGERFLTRQRGGRRWGLLWAEDGVFGAAAQPVFGCQGLSRSSARGFLLQISAGSFRSRFASPLLPRTC